MSTQPDPVLAQINRTLVSLEAIQERLGQLSDKTIRDETHGGES